MIDNLLESDIEQLAPNVYGEVRRLGKAGTTGVTFYALERPTGRPTGRPVLIKISRAEDGARRSLLAEAEALKNQQIATCAEPDRLPTAREYYAPLHPRGRVGLVLEWLDESYTTVEDLAQDPSFKFGELRLLRIIVPLVRLIATAHQAGFLYVDIGNKKADHLWWRISHQADGTWQVPQGVDGLPAFQLKVIDWANAIKMSDPAYNGAVTPQNDISGVAELMFYMSRGPHVALPANPAELAREPLDDIIRRALFADADDSFVKQTQGQLTYEQRAGIWRDADLRSAATREFERVLSDYYTRLLRQTENVVIATRTTVEALEQAAAQGLVALNLAVEQELAKRLRPADAQDPTLATTQGRARRLLDKVREESERALAWDPDLIGVADFPLRAKPIIDEYLSLENTRRDLLQLDSKRAKATLERLNRSGSNLMPDDTLMLRRLTLALEEAEQLSGELDHPHDEPLVQRLSDTMLDTHKLLNPLGARQAYDSIKNLGRWGNGPAVRDFRIELGRRAGVSSVGDEAARLQLHAEEMRQEAETNSLDPNQSQRRRALEAASAQDIELKAAELERALAQLAPQGAGLPAPSLPALALAYGRLQAAVAELLALEHVADAASILLADTLGRLIAVLRLAESALDEGNVKPSLQALSDWAALDPLNAFAAEYGVRVGNNQQLDRKQLAGQVSAIASGGQLLALLQALPTGLQQLALAAPNSAYVSALGSLTATLTPILEKALSTAPGSSPARTTLATALSTAARDVLLDFLRGDTLRPEQLGQEALRLSQTGGAELLHNGELLGAWFDIVARWNEPNTQRLSPQETAQAHVPLLAKGLHDVATLPLLAPLCAVYAEKTRGMCERQAKAAFGTQDYDAAAAWFRATTLLPGGQNALVYYKVAFGLSEVAQLWNQHGPSAALERLAAVQRRPEFSQWQASAPQITVAPSSLGQVMQLQLTILEGTQSGLVQVLKKSGADAVAQIESMLARLQSDLAQADDALCVGVSPRLRCRTLAQDLLPLYYLWGRYAPPPPSRPNSYLPPPAPNVLAVADMLALAQRLNAVVPTNPPSGQAPPAPGRTNGAEPHLAARSEVIERIYAPLAQALVHISGGPPPPPGNPPYPPPNPPTQSGNSPQGGATRAGQNPPSPSTPGGPNPSNPPASRSRLPLLAIGLPVLLIAGLLTGYIILRGNGLVGGDPTPTPTITPSPTETIANPAIAAGTATAAAIAIQTTNAAASATAAALIPPATDTPLPPATDTPLPPATDTPLPSIATAPPTNTVTTTLTLTPIEAFTPNVTDTVALTTSPTRTTTARKTVTKTFTPTKTRTPSRTPTTALAATVTGTPSTSVTAPGTDPASVAGTALAVAAEATASAIAVETANAEVTASAIVVETANAEVTASAIAAEKANAEATASAVAAEKANAEATASAIAAKTANAETTASAIAAKTANAETTASAIAASTVSAQETASAKSAATAETIATAAAAAAAATASAVAATETSVAATATALAGSQSVVPPPADPPSSTQPLNLGGSFTISFGPGGGQRARLDARGAVSQIGELFTGWAEALVNVDLGRRSRFECQLGVSLNVTPPGSQRDSWAVSGQLNYADCKRKRK